MIIVTAASFILLIYSVFKDIFIAYPLVIILTSYSFMLYRRGYKVSEILKMIFEGGKKSLIVLRIFILIGAITSIWMAAGTVPGIVYYGIKFLRPELFVLSAFLISCIVSFLIGTSLGTVSTAGIALMVMAKGGGVDASMTAGAIIAGAYFGDRASPMSSSANLVASISETNLYENVKRMMKTTITPFLISAVFYLLLSISSPLNSVDNFLSKELETAFNTGGIVLIPALLIIVLSIFRVDVKISMLASIGAAILISIYVQGESLVSSLKYLFMGYNMESDGYLSTIIKGGGILSMLKISVIVFISSSFAGIFEGTGLLGSIENFIGKSKSRGSLFGKTALVSIFTAAFGCTQAISIILTNQLVRKSYENRGVKRVELALDIENTAVVLAPLIPWNIAGLVPASTLGVSWEYIPYAVYLYLLPVIILISLRGKERYELPLQIE